MNLDPKSSKDGSKFDTKLIKTNRNLILGVLVRSKSFRGCAETRSGRVRDAQRPPQDRSWDALGEPKAAGRRTKPCPGWSRDAPRWLQSPVQTRPAHQVPSNALAGQFFNVFVLLHERSKLKIRAPTQCFVRVGGSR